MSTSASIEQGREQARAIAERTRQREGPAVETAAAPKQTLLLEGDSWFDYPAPDFLTTDLAEELESLGYQVESAAHHGDTLESMAYDLDQTAKVQRVLRRLHDTDRRPRAILLSGGGNDIAGTLFEVLLDHRRSVLPSLNLDILDGLVNRRLREAMLFWFGVVDGSVRELFNESIPLVVHGYDYAVPDGRGVWGGGWILPGPWLRPGFEKKGYLDAAARQEMTIQIIDAFNTMLESIATSAPLGPGQVAYVDLRGTLPHDDTYQDWWANELHPTNRGFQRVAERMDAVIRTLP